MEPIIKHMVRTLKNLYDPPVRGLSSKKKRQRAKANKKLNGTMRGLTHQWILRGNPFLKLSEDNWTPVITEYDRNEDTK